MHDDLVLLSQVIDAGGFTRASIRTGISKSRLSRRIEELERRFGVRLIERSSRHFTPTPIGLDLAALGETIRMEGESALGIVQESLSKPTGSLRVASPSFLTENTVADFCVEFSRRNPQVLVTLDTTDGNIPGNMDAYDIALIASWQELPDLDMIARRLRYSEYALVVSPSLFSTLHTPTKPSDLNNLPAIGWLEDQPRPTWQIVSDGGEVTEINVRARMVTNNLKIAHKAALGGLGMTRLPRTLCNADLVSGRLLEVLPGWQPPTISIHAVYRTRRSLQLAGRVFIDELLQALRSA